MDKNNIQINDFDELYLTVYNEINCRDEQKKIKIAQSISNIISLSQILSYYMSYENFRNEIDKNKLACIIKILNNDFNAEIDTSLIKEIIPQKIITTKNNKNQIIFNYGYRLNEHEYVCYAALSTIAELVLNNNISFYYEKTSRTLNREGIMAENIKNGNLIFDPIRLNVNEVNCDFNNNIISINDSDLTCVRGKTICSIFSAMYLSDANNNIFDNNICVIVSDYQNDVINEYFEYPQYIIQNKNDFDDISSELSIRILENIRLNELVKNRVYIKSKNVLRDYARAKITHSILARAIYRYFEPMKNSTEQNDKIVNFIIDFYNEFAKINYKMFECSKFQKDINYAPLYTFGIECEIYFCSLMINKSDSNLHDLLLKSNFIFEQAPVINSVKITSVKKYVDEAMNYV